MKDWETNEIGTEQALREALDLLGIKVEGSPVEAWRNERKSDQEFIYSLYKPDQCQHKWTNQYPSGKVCVYCSTTIMTDIHVADLEGRN